MRAVDAPSKGTIMSDPSAPTPPYDPTQQPPTPPAPPAPPTPPENPYANTAAPGAPLSPAADIQWASFAHLGGILSFLPSLIIWLVFKDRGRFTNTEAKEALNFQLTLLIAEVAAGILSVVLTVITFGFFGFNLGWLIWVVGVIFSIIAFMQVKDGRGYRYPFAIRMIK
jgi:uncharacterized Tic20 family protein